MSRRQRVKRSCEPLGLLFVGALALLAPGVMTDGLGLVVLGVVTARQYVAVNGSVPFASDVSR